MADKFSQDDVAARAQQIERILLQTVPWDVRKKGGADLQQSLRDLWETAVRIGFQYGEEEVARVEEKMSGEIERVRKEAYEEGCRAGEAKLDLATRRARRHARIEMRTEQAQYEFESRRVKAGLCEELERTRREVHAGRKEAYEAGRYDEREAATARHEKALERERVWGFDVGWRLGLGEMRRVRNPSLTTLAPPAAPATDAAPSTTTTTSTTAADALVPAAVKSFDWAEDASHLPTTPVSEPPPPPVRDFSCLRSDAHKPFASINRRRQRAPRHSIHRPRQQKSQWHPGHTVARTRRDYGYEKPPPPFNQPSSTPLSVALDWDRDPRLQDLGRALTALGWVRPLP